MTVSDKDLNVIFEIDAVFSGVVVALVEPIIFFIRIWFGRCLSGKVNPNMSKF